MDDLKTILAMLMEMRTDVSQIRAEMAEMRNEIAEMRTEMTELRTEMRAEFVQVRAEMEEMKTELKAHTEETETKLLSAFWNWARTADMRERQQNRQIDGLAENTQLFNERLSMVEDRLSDLERRR